LVDLIKLATMDVIWVTAAFGARKLQRIVANYKDVTAPRAAHPFYDSDPVGREFDLGHEASA
jgi:hypothetical protein